MACLESDIPNYKFEKRWTAKEGKVESISSMITT